MIHYIYCNLYRFICNGLVRLFVDLTGPSMSGFLIAGLTTSVSRSGWYPRIFEDYLTRSSCLVNVYVLFALLYSFLLANRSQSWIPSPKNQSSTGWIHMFLGWVAATKQWWRLILERILPLWSSPHLLSSSTGWVSGGTCGELQTRWSIPSLDIMAVSQNGGCHEPWVSILFVSSFGWFGITHFLVVLFYDFTIFQWIFRFLRSQKAVRTLILDWFINISWCSEVAIIVKHWCAPRSCPFVLHRCQITSVFWSACFLVEHMFFIVESPCLNMLSIALTLADVWWNNMFAATLTFDHHQVAEGKRISIHPRG